MSLGKHSKWCHYRSREVDRQRLFHLEIPQSLEAFARIATVRFCMITIRTCIQVHAFRLGR